MPSGASEAAALETDCADPQDKVTADIKHNGDSELRAQCQIVSFSHA